MEGKVLDLFTFNSYLDWLKAVWNERKSQRGYHKAMAEAAGCQPSFLSQVLRGKTHLTPDQAAGLCEFWAFSPDESEYFLSLVHFERSGSKKYRRLLSEKLETLRQANAQVSKRLQHRGTIQVEWQTRYYSDWYWAFIHILSSVESFQDPARMAVALGLEADKVVGVLKELRGMGLVEQKGHRWAIGPNQIHLDRSSPLHVVNQRNFRQFAQNSLSREKLDDLHYCGVYGLSTVAYQQIREMLLKLIASANKAVLESKEEQGACMVIDLVSI